MNVTGMESEEGEVGVETVSTPEQRQEASRRYRDQVDKHEQISEFALDSVPIPLGHRQTIRRYFQMIRPQDAEMDGVLHEEKDTSEK